MKIINEDGSYRRIRLTVENERKGCKGISCGTRLQCEIIISNYACIRYNIQLNRKTKEFVLQHFNRMVKINQCYFNVMASRMSF
jgi:hypothetical protein